MAYVYENITSQDIEAYKLHEANRTISKGGDEDRHLSVWSIDREKKSYLRYMGCNWQEPEEKEHSFYWQTQLIRVRTYEIVTPRHISCALRTGFNALWLPPEIEHMRPEILNDFKQAYLSYDNKIGYYTVDFKF